MGTRTTEFIAKVTGDANSAIAAMQRVQRETQAVGQTAQTANAKMASGTDVFVKNAEKAARGVAAITQALYAMEAQGSAKILAIGGAVGSFADLLGPQGKVVSGIAIVTSSIIALFMQAKEKSREAAESMIRDIRAMQAAGDLSGLEKRRTQLFSGDKLFDDPNEKKDENAAARAEVIRKGGIVELRKEIAALNAEVRKTGPALDEGGAAMEAFNRKRATAQAKLTPLIALEAKLAAEYKLTNAALQPLIAGEVERTTVGLKLEAEQKAAEKAKQALEQLQAKVKDIGQQIDKTIENVFLDDELKRAAAVKAIDDEAAARERNSAQIAAQVTALLQSKQAYEELLIVQAQDDAERELRDKAAKAGLQDIEARVKARRAEVAEELRVKKIRDGLAGRGEAKPPEVKSLAIDAGRFAEHLAEALGAASGISVAFGEAGQKINQLLAGTSQLFTSMSRLQRAGVFTDKAGKEQNVGILGALSGKAGNAGVIAGISSGLSVVGAVASIADSLDLFGARSAQQARELRERAIAFNRSLDEFAAKITPQSGAAAEITRVQREFTDLLAELPIKLITLQERFGDLFDGATVTSPRLRELADALKASGPRYAENAAQVLRLAQTLEQLEASARKQVLATLEDLGVRRLQAAGMSEEAETLRAAIAARRELATAEQDTTSEGMLYAESLRIIQTAEAAVAAETKRRAAIMQQLADDNALLGGTGADRLQRTITAFNASFGQFSGIFEGLDLTTRDGLSKAKELIKSIYRNLAVDGVSEAERPLVEFLKSLLGDVDGLLSALPESVDRIGAALTAFGERVQLFGLTIPEQMQELARIFTGSFGDWFESALAGVDLSSAESRAQFKDILEGQLKAILADNEITDAESPLFNALKQMLGLVNQAIEDAANEASAAAAEQLAGRDRNRSFFANIASVFDLDGAQAFRTKLLGFGTAFSDLFRLFDLESIDGIEAAKASLRGVFETLQSMSDEEILARFGLTRDELVAALLDTNSGLNSLKDGLQSVEEATRAAAQATKDFVESVSQDFLRSQGQGQAADVNDATKRRDARLAQAVQMGLGAEILAQIDAIYQADLADIAAKYATAGSATTSAGDIVSASAGASITGARGNARRGGSNSSLVQDFGGLSQVLAESLSGLLREIAVNTSEVGPIVAALVGRTTLRPLSSLSFPSYSTSTAGGGGVVINTINVTIGSLNPAGVPITQVGDVVAREVARSIGQLAAAEAKFLGSARR